MYQIVPSDPRTSVVTHIKWRKLNSRNAVLKYNEHRWIKEIIQKYIVSSATYADKSWGKQRTHLFTTPSFSLIITLHAKCYEETDQVLESKDFLIIVNYRVDANKILTHDSRTRNHLGVTKASYCQSVW